MPVLFTRPPFFVSGNQAPTNIAVTGASVLDNAVDGDVFATFIVTDVDSVALNGVTISNNKFKIINVSGLSGQIARSANGSLTVGVNETYTLTATDSSGNAFTDTLETVSVIDHLASSLLATPKLVKTDATTIATGAIPVSLGLGFKDGDMPVGQWPILKTAGGTTIPYSYWGKNTWASGCMKTLKVLPRIPEAITGTTGTLYNVQVWNGGSEPSTTSARALSDSPDFNTILTGVTNLSGAWTSSLAQGRTDNNKVRILGQGVTGIYAAIGQEYMQASNHGQLECEHYVMILQDAAGGHYGTRHIGFGMQPHADVTSPTATARQFTAVKRHGSTSIRTMQGISHSDSTTPTNTISCSHYAGFFDCGLNAQMDFVAGTRAAEAPLRWQHDMPYWISTRLLPPLDLSIATNVGPAYDYRAEFKGPLETYDCEAGGERIEIAVFAGYHTRFMKNQTADEEQTMRMAGLVPGAWRAHVRLAATRKPVVVNNGPNKAGGNYTGLGTTHATGWSFLSGGQKFGIVVPAEESSIWAGDWDTSHKGGAASYVPWLFTGEWQYLDMMEDCCLMSVMMEQDGPGTFHAMPWAAGDGGADWFYRHWTIGATTYYGVASINSQNLIRVSAWRMAGLAQLFAGQPDVDPAGTQVKQYTSDILEDSYACFNAFNAAQSSNWNLSGQICFRGPPATEGGWTMGYYLGAMACGYALTQKASALTSLNHVGKFFANLASRSTHFGQAMGFQIRSRDENGVLIQDPALVMGSTAACSQTPNVTANTYTNNNEFGGWTPTNGDRWSELYQNVGLGGQSLPGPILYVVNASGQTYQLATTPGGSPIDLNDSRVIDRFYLDATNYAGFSWEQAGGFQGYVASVPAAIKYATAAGCTTLGNALSKANALQALPALDLDFDSQNKNALKASFV